MFSNVEQSGDATFTQQRDLFQGRSVADAGFACHLNKGTSYHLLAESGDPLFPGELFADLYTADGGWSAAAPSVLMKSPVVDYHEPISAADVVEPATGHT